MGLITNTVGCCRSVSILGVEFAAVLLVSACGQDVAPDSLPTDSGGGDQQAAPLAWPYSTATNGQTAYVADTFNHVIRAIDLTTGQVTTLAGANGMLGSDDGVGETARFYWPKGMVVGPDLFVADSGNHTIRRIVPATGEVTTLAGSAGLGGSEDGIGSAARFASPKALAIDGSDVLYVADTFNNAVRRITISTTEVSTVVDATAGLSNPQGLAVDSRSIYVADTDHHVIRRIDKLTGTVSLLAGRERISGASDGEGLVATFSAPQGLAIDRTNLYVCDSGNHTIRLIDLADDRFPVSTIAGSAGMPGSADGIGAQARFNAPVGLSTDGASLFIADTFNSTIRQLGLASGQVTTLAGRAPS